MSLDTAAQLEDPAPLSLQSSCEGLGEQEEDDSGLVRASFSTIHTVCQLLLFSWVYWRNYLNCLLARVSIFNKFVSHGLDVVDLFLPQFQLSHETLNNPDLTVKSQSWTENGVFLLNFLI